MPLPKIMLWNAGSLPRKRNELILALAGLRTGIILVTATWLTPTDTFTLPGYSIVRSDCPTRGGGDAILIHGTIKYSNCSPAGPPPCEACFIRLTAPRIIIGVMYAPHCAIKDSGVFDTLVRMGSPYLIGGDWNAKHKLWNNYSTNKAGNMLHDHFCKNPYRIIYPDKFIHHTRIGRPSTLDFFITDYHVNFSCDTTDDFDTAHRPVILTATHSTVPPGIDATTDWKVFCNLSHNRKITRNFSSIKEIDNSIKELTSFLHACRQRATIVSTTLNKEAHLLTDPTLLSFIRHRRALR